MRYLLLLLPFLLAACSQVSPRLAAPPMAAPVAAVSPVGGVDGQATSQPTPADTACPLPEAAEEPATAAEIDQSMEEEVQGLERLGEWEAGRKPVEEGVTYDFPVTINRQVEFYLELFQGKQRRTFARWLGRAGRYLPMIRAKLAEAGLPLDLAYLPMIESGFNVRARSSAGAVGPWQFMAKTARHYGLTVDRYLDQRRDPVAATDSAILFLTDLYREFGSWELAVAGYNAGGGTIRRAMRKTGKKDFWALARSRYLRTETKRYVPKLIAAIIIAKEPEKYGFTDLACAPPLEYATVEVPPWTALQAVAVAGDLEVAALRELNPELRRGVTPPSGTYTLKVPKGKEETIAANLPLVQAIVRTTYASHVVGRHDTLDRICRRYDIDKTTLLKANDLRKSKLPVGRRLRIPVRRTEYVLVDPAHPPAGTTLVMHRVRPGEALSTIARRYHVSVGQLMAWNNITNPDRIRAGSQLALHLVNDNDDTSGKPVLTASRRKATPQAVPATRRPPTYYEVRRGDSLWKIARRFRTTTEALRNWNDLAGDRILPGTRLVVRPGNDDDA